MLISQELLAANSRGKKLASSVTTLYSCCSFCLSASIFSVLRAHKTSLHPNSASRQAVASPMPEDAPSHSADTRPVSPGNSLTDKATVWQHSLLTCDQGDLPGQRWLQAVTEVIRLQFALDLCRDSRAASVRAILRGQASLPLRTACFPACRELIAKGSSTVCVTIPGVCTRACACTRDCASIKSDVSTAGWQINPAADLPGHWT